MSNHDPFAGHLAVTAKQAEELTGGDIKASRIRALARAKRIRPTTGSGDRNKRFAVESIRKLLEVRA